MQLKWKINQMDCYPEFSGATDYVFNVHWDCLAYYNGISGGPFYGRTYGVTSVPSSPGPVTPYLDLQEEQVFSWVYAAMPSGQKDIQESGAVQQILDRISPPVVTPPNPWPSDIFPVIAPSISVQPQGQMTLWSGQTAYVSILAQGQPLAYQWRKDSLNLSGATGDGLQISNIQTDQAGYYDVVINNSLGSVTSSGCNIIVNPPVLPVINNQPNGGQIDCGGIFGMSVTASGYPTPSYQWALNGSEISGAVNSSYSMNNIQENQAGDYTVKVFNVVGEVVSQVAHLDVIVPVPASPTILVQPVSVDTSLNSMVYFNVIGSGYPPFTYQWYKDGQMINGANDNIYRINQVKESDAGIYTVILTNSEGPTISNEASLSIIS